MILITIINQDLHTLIPIIFEFKDKIKKRLEEIWNYKQNGQKIAVLYKIKLSEENKENNLTM